MTNTYTPRVVSLADEHGVRVIDPIEDVQFPLYTPDTATVTPASDDDAPWYFPVDTAFKLDAASIRTPYRVSGHVRRPDGSLLTEDDADDQLAVDERGCYLIELTNFPIKLYIYAESRIRRIASKDQTVFSFPDTDSIQLGIRSMHGQPARTLTTTRKPEDLMQVISEFGAALKTTTCERSFPTLRGHPPLIEFGEELDIPGGTRRPDTGVTIELPPEIEYIYPAASLTYYLGAQLVPGETPRLTTTAGVEYEFNDENFAQDVTQLLKHVFTLDCLTRTEGYYPIELHEREQVVESGVELDWKAVYEQPLAEQLGTYLDVPFEPIAAVAPRWRLTADVVPDIEHAPILPHLGNELAKIRIFADEDSEHTEQTLNSRESTDPQHLIEELLREPQGTPVEKDDVLRVPPAETLTQTYVGDGFPINANKSTQQAYERKLRQPTAQSENITVTVVCNDERMSEELAVGQHYGSHEMYDFDVELRSQTSVEELRSILASKTDLLHYIGHVDSRGLQAADGYLDARTMDSVGASMFVLNSCRSFKQGQALVERGATAGIVTLETIGSQLATDVGLQISRLLNHGWTLDTAIELISESLAGGQQYIVVGDGATELVAPDGGSLILYDLRPQAESNKIDVTLNAYSTATVRIGGMYQPHLGGDKFYIASGEMDTITVPESELMNIFEIGSSPVRINQRKYHSKSAFYWTDKLSIEDIRTSYSNT